MNYTQPIILTGEERTRHAAWIERMKAEQRARDLARECARLAVRVLLGAQRRASAAMVAKGWDGAGRGT